MNEELVNLLASLRDLQRNQELEAVAQKEQKKPGWRERRAYFEGKAAAYTIAAHCLENILEGHK